MRDMLNDVLLGVYVGSLAVAVWQFWRLRNLLRDAAKYRDDLRAYVAALPKRPPAASTTEPEPVWLEREDR